MKILDIKTLALSEIKVIRFAKFGDHRGYFTETLRMSDIDEIKGLDFLKGYKFPQTNENFSHKGVIKGLHFQWDPPLGKLLRTISGHMVDMILDIRQNSPTFGKIILYDMPDNSDKDYGEWIWLPPGFAHGSFFPEESITEYFFTVNYNAQGEAGISPLAQDLDWSLTEPKLKEEFNKLVGAKNLMSEKDSNGLSLQKWQEDERFSNFVYKK